MEKNISGTVALLACGFMAMGYYLYKDIQKVGTESQLTEAVTPVDFDPDPSVSLTTIPLPVDEDAAFEYMDDPMAYANNPSVPALAVGTHGYLQYDMHCVPEGVTGNGGPAVIRCQTLDNGQLIDAQFLSLLPPVLNVDLLRPDFNCTMLCIDAEGYPVGRAQVEMFKWREDNCSRNEVSGIWHCGTKK